jgi:hypothetical protein
MAFVAITAINAFMGDTSTNKGLMSKGLASNPDLKPQFSSNTKFADVMGALRTCLLTHAFASLHELCRARLLAVSQVRCSGSAAAAVPEPCCRAHPAPVQAWTRPRLSWRRLWST